ISVQGDFGGGGGGGGAGATGHGHFGWWTVGNGWVNLVSGGSGGIPPAGNGGSGAAPVLPQYPSVLTSGSFWPAGGRLGGGGGGPRRCRWRPGRRPARKCRRPSHPGLRVHKLHRDDRREWRCRRTTYSE